MDRLPASRQARVVVLGGSRIAVSLGRGVRVGSDTECDIVLKGGDIAAHHLDILHDERGFVLDVNKEAERVHVNARPVREKAVLRCGDLISVGTHKLLLRQDDERVRTGGADAGLSRSAPGQVALRSVAGALSGRRIGVDVEQDLDSSMLAGCAGTLNLRNAGQAIAFKFTGARGAPAPEVNGVVATSGHLVAGDQLAFCGHRFVVEIPGHGDVPEPSMHLAPQEAALPEATAGPQNEVWWLILTAALLALGMAVLLLWNR